MTMTQPMQVLTSHETAEWYTPPFVIELVRQVLGTIDLDPASDAIPQKWIRANTYLSALGLMLEWNATAVFCNPPYGKAVYEGKSQSNQALWSAKMVHEFGVGRFNEGILLINSTHGYKWYEELWTRYTCCLARERIRFIKPDGTVGGQAKRGQTFVYFGEDDWRFAEVFRSLGRIVRP